jgi:hypothetical protein
VGASTVIGFLGGPYPAELVTLHYRFREVRAAAAALASPVAAQILLQVAMRDIGQLTDFVADIPVARHARRRVVMARRSASRGNLLAS